jgi:uncharacterized protein HemX
MSGPTSMSAATRQTTRLMMLGGAVLLLAVGAYSFNQTRISKQFAERNLLQQQSELNAAIDKQKLAERNAKLIQQVKALQTEAEKISALPQSWGERQINLKQQNLFRDQVNPLLLSSQRNANQILKLDEFELAVTSVQEGLFDQASTAKQPLMLSFRGSLYFRLAEGQ